METLGSFSLTLFVLPEERTKTNLALSIVLCLCLTRVCVCVCVSMYKLETNVTCFPQPLWTLLFEAGSFSKSGAHRFC